MRILVFQELNDDPQPPPERDHRSGRVRREWQVREMKPADAAALELALAMKARRPGSEVTLIHLGPQEAEPWLREGLARGADRVVRLWEDDLAELRAPGKALVMSAAARALGFDLALLGTGSPGDRAPGGQTAQLLAAELGLPCLTQALELEPGSVAGWLQATRALEGGFRERLEVKLPAVAGVAGEGGEQLASLPALLAAEAAIIPVWDLAELGLPEAALRAREQVLRYGQVHQPRPRLRPMAAPNSSLPAFERIQQLLQGTTRRREGRLVRGTDEELVEEIFQTLLTEGWLDHLRPDAGQ